MGNSDPHSIQPLQAPKWDSAQVPTVMPSSTKHAWIDFLYCLVLLFLVPLTSALWGHLSKTLLVSYYASLGEPGEDISIKCFKSSALLFTFQVKIKIFFTSMFSYKGHNFCIVYISIYQWIIFTILWENLNICKSGQSSKKNAMYITQL